jgi:hypothetical protein
MRRLAQGDFSAIRTSRTNLRGAFREFLAESLERLYLSQAMNTLENVDFKSVPGGVIKLPMKVLFCEFVPM